MAEIIVSKSIKVKAIVDDEDFERVAKHRWHDNGNGYIRSWMQINGRRKHVLLSRFIMNAPEYMVVDHVNRNPYDNRKRNLRVTTIKENNNNRKTKRKSKFETNTRLEEILLEKNLKRCDVARAVNISSPYFSKICRGEATISPGLLFKLSTYLQVDPKELSGNIHIKSYKTKLAKKIAEKDFKIVELAKMLKISPSYFSEIKSGKRRMSADILMRLAEILDCDASEIYGNVEEPETVEAA